jgi:hypothetical protein
MKNLTAIILLLSVISCKNADYKIGPGGEKLEGNGKVSSQQREVSPFNAIELKGVFNTVLVQGTKEAVLVETDENLQELITVKVENNVLKVGMKDSTSFGKVSKMVVRITLVDLSRLQSESVGSLSCASTLRLPHHLKVKVQSVGTTSLDLDADTLEIEADIVGNLDLKGKVHLAHIRHDGLGSIHAFGLETYSMELITNGIGSSEVFATHELNVKANGVGGVRYKGDPERKEIKNDGLGKVVAAE